MHFRLTAIQTLSAYPKDQEIIDGLRGAIKDRQLLVREEAKRLLTRLTGEQFEMVID